MPIVVYCKACAKKIRVPEGPPGRKGKCPQCGVAVLIPSASETAPPVLDKRTPVVADAEDDPAPAKAEAPTHAVQPAQPVKNSDQPVSKDKAGGPEKDAATTEEKKTATASPAPASEKPVPEKPAGKPEEKRKPKKIALGLGSAAMNEEPGAVATPKRKPDTSQAKKNTNAADRTEGMEVLREKDAVEWGEEPEVKPSRSGFYVGLAVFAGIFLLTLIAWWLWGRAVPHAAEEDRKKQRELHKLEKVEP